MIAITSEGYSGVIARPSHLPVSRVMAVGLWARLVSQWKKAEDHLCYLSPFLGALVTDFAAYLESSDIDLVADRVGYRQVPMWLSDSEFDDMTSAMAAIVQDYLDREPAADRRRRLLTTIVMPDDRTSG